MLQSLVAVLQPGGGGVDAGSSVGAAVEFPDQLLAALERHRVGPLWYEAVRGQAHLRQLLPAALEQELANLRRQHAALALLHEQLALETSRKLHQAGVRHVFFKGTQLRRSLYRPASLRPADDVDVLVSAKDRTRAREALLAGGFTYADHHALVTHEESLTWQGAQLDLHWRLFRPGRPRFDPTDEALQAARENGGLPLLAPTHALAQLILSTALGDYVTSRLIRAVDIDRFIRQSDPDWHAVVDWIIRLGLAPAAWVTLVWVHDWFTTPVPSRVWAALSPGRSRRRYLRAWLERDPWQVHSQCPTLARLGFSLALQQSATDVLRAASKRSLASLKRS